MELGTAAAVICEVEKSRSLGQARMYHITARSEGVYAANPFGSVSVSHVESTKGPCMWRSMTGNYRVCR